MFVPRESVSHEVENSKVDSFIVWCLIVREVIFGLKNPFEGVGSVECGKGNFWLSGSTTQWGTVVAR
ncbi:hypothetical protein HanRHA438_Chr12g0567881 [Helianthus annuus]|nr:hypothetical protein HanRHA438_Chr12g0567881 [Helianthus annuus]